ncbi:MAG: ribonuclease III, partial [Gammaproteobacteria bacterium]|nr:ribonuclease III [Gammaproteobacteria bacterium]
GDAVLGLVMSEALYSTHPQADEGTLSRLRARLVRRDTLEELARELELGDLLRLGTGELRSGGHRRASILANSLEAVLGAIFLDGGWRITEEVILKLMSSRLASLDSGDDLRDPKTRLQEFLQGRGYALPVYAVERVSGSGHAQHFGVICRLANPGLEVRGEGASRRAAEQQAARQALRELGADD